MTNSQSQYASEAETKDLLAPDTRTPAERKLAQMMTERGADEQGAEAYPILHQIALDLLAEQPAQQEPVAWGWAIMRSDGTCARIRPRRADFFGSIEKQNQYTSEDAKHADQVWAGLAPHTIVTLCTSPPAQQDIQRLSKPSNNQQPKEAK